MDFKEIFSAWVEEEAKKLQAGEDAVRGEQHRRRLGFAFIRNIIESIRQEVGNNWVFDVGDDCAIIYLKHYGQKRSMKHRINIGATRNLPNSAAAICYIRASADAFDCMLWDDHLDTGCYSVEEKFSDTPEAVERITRFIAEQVAKELSTQ